MIGKTTKKTSKNVGLGCTKDQFCYADQPPEKSIQLLATDDLSRASRPQSEADGPQLWYENVWKHKSAARRPRFRYESAWKDQ